MSNKKNGSALLLVVIVMGMTFILAAFMIKSSINHRQNIDIDLNKEKAYYCANTGMIDLIFYVYDKAFNVTKGTAISNNYDNNKRLLNDINALYEANIEEDIIKPTESNPNQNDPGIYVLKIKSKGTYRDKQCIMIASINIFTTYDNILKKYIYDKSKGYIINSLQVYNN